MVPTIKPTESPDMIAFHAEAERTGDVGSRHITGLIERGAL